MRQVAVRHKARSFDPETQTCLLRSGESCSDEYRDWDWGDMHAVKRQDPSTLFSVDLEKEGEAVRRRHGSSGRPRRSHQSGKQRVRRFEAERRDRTLYIA